MKRTTKKTIKTNRVTFTSTSPKVERLLKLIPPAGITVTALKAKLGGNVETTWVGQTLNRWVGRGLKKIGDGKNAVFKRAA